VHLFVALGSGILQSVGALWQGDAVRISNPDPLPTTDQFTATADGTELLIWVTA
jgi:hypothetical protein